VLGEKFEFDTNMASAGSSKIFSETVAIDQQTFYFQPNIFH